MATREAKFTTRLKKYLAAHPEILGDVYGAALEVKVTPDKSIPFDAVKEHQLGALNAVNEGTFLYKIPDAGWQNPFDIVYFRGAPAYVVLAFEHGFPAKYSFYFLHVFNFVELRDNLDAKSITEDVLKEHGYARYSF